VIFPLVFASSVFVPVSTFPDWLQAFAKITPSRHRQRRPLARALRHPGIAGSRRGLDGGLLAVFIRCPYALPADQLSRVPPPEDPHHVPVESPATDGQARPHQNGRSARGQRLTDPVADRAESALSATGFGVFVTFGNLCLVAVYTSASVCGGNT